MFSASMVLQGSSNYKSTTVSGWLVLQLPGKEDEPRERNLKDGGVYGEVLYGRFYSERQVFYFRSSDEPCVKIRVLRRESYKHSLSKVRLRIIPARIFDLLSSKIVM